MIFTSIAPTEKGCKTPVKIVLLVVKFQDFGNYKKRLRNSDFNDIITIAKSVIIH